MSVLILPTAHVSGLARWPDHPLFAGSPAQMLALAPAGLAVPEEFDKGLELQMELQRAL